MALLHKWSLVSDISEHLPSYKTNMLHLVHLATIQLQLRSLAEKLLVGAASVAAVVYDLES